MNALGMDDFTVIESLWNMIEQDMEVTQKNLLRTLTAIGGIQTDSLIYDPLKEYLHENEGTEKRSREKVFA